MYYRLCIFYCVHNLCLEVYKEGCLMTLLFYCPRMMKKTRCRSGAMDVVSHERITTNINWLYCVDKIKDLAELLT
jgi:hypothetical protein